MALERIGPTSRPAGIPDRQPVQPSPAARAPGPVPLEVDFPVGPLLPGGPNSTGGPGAVGVILDNPEGRPLPPSNAEALAAALADMPNGADPAAMRPNQVFLSRQLVWQPPDTALMAASWQVMVRTYGEQRAAWLEQASGRHVPSKIGRAHV